METRINKSGLDSPHTLPVTTDIRRLQPLFIAPCDDVTFSNHPNLYLIALRKTTSFKAYGQIV